MKQVSAGPFSIELHKAQTQVCECCFHSHQNLLRFVSVDKQPYCIYYVMVPAHDDEPVSVMATMGDFASESDEQRFSVTFELRSDEQNIVTTVVNPGATGWVPATNGRALPANEGLTFMQDTSFMLSNLIARHDPPVAKRLGYSDRVTLLDKLKSFLRKH